MSLRKKIILLIIVVFVLLLLMLGGKKASQTKPSSNVPPTSTSTSAYLLGIGYSHFNSVPERPQAMAKLKQVADVIYIQRPWRESSSDPNFFSVLTSDVDEARKHGIKIYISIELLDPERKKIELPAGLTGDFSAPAVQLAYIDFVKKIAKMYAPDYFILNVEANTLKKYNPADFAAFPSFYARTYDAAKEASPKTKVGVSLVLTSNNDNGCFESSDIASFKNDAADFPKGDIFAVSVFPMCYSDPKLLPDTFLKDIGALSSKPLFISETGWVSEGAGGIGSEANQAGYIENLSKAANYATTRGIQIEAINYVGLVDPSKQVCDFVILANPALSWYCRLALMRPDASEKPAYTAFKKWNESLK